MQYFKQVQMNKPCHCITIMQMEGVACLGMENTPGRSAKRSRKDSPENVLSRRGCLRARAKWSFSVCQTIVKMIPTERARRNEEVSVGFTLNGVTVEKL